MPSRSRKVRGRRSELAVAEYLQAIWPQAQAVASSLPGRDIQHTPGYAVEVKARRSFDPLAWIRQARKNAGSDLPVVVMRPDGVGEQRMGEWLVLLRLEDFTSLVGLLEGSDGDTEDRASVRDERGGDPGTPGVPASARPQEPPDEGSGL